MPEARDIQRGSYEQSIKEWEVSQVCQQTDYKHDSRLLCLTLYAMRNNFREVSCENSYDDRNPRCIPTNTVSHQSHHIVAFADTGAQSCSSGPETQTLLRYPDEYLMLTTHRVRCITNNRLHINGVLFLCVRVGPRETRQVVFVADNTSGLYLSRTALKD